MPELFFDRLKIILQNPLWWILFAIAVFVLWIISTRHKYKKREPSTYSDLIKQYRERYMDAVYKMPECVKEIQERALNSFHIAKTSQEIIFDLKQSSTPVSKGALTNKRRSGGILLVAKMPIHTSLIEICQIFIRNNDIYITNNYYSDCGIFKLNTSHYKRHNVSWNPPDWRRFNYNMYIVSPNTALNLITETIKSIFDHSSKCETNAKYITRLNSLLNPYKIHTEMTQKSWNFFFDGTPISLEEAVRKLPDDVLLKQTPSISRNTPTSAQKKPIKPPPTVAKNNLSQKEYLSQLEDLCYKFGDDAKRHLADIQRQTGYNRKKVESDLEKVRGQLKSLPLQKQPQSQPRPSSPGAAQDAPTTAREPILVLAPYIVDYIITQFVDSDFCFDEVLGVPDEVRKDLTKYTAIGAWVDEKDPLMRYMEVCNNDITFYKILESPALLSFKITEKEKYQKVHFSMIVAVNDEISTYMLNRPAPMHQLDDADYKRLEQSLLLRRQDIEDKYNLGNFQDYVERVKIAIPLKTSSEAPTPPQSQPRASTPTPAQQALVPPPKAPNKPSIEEELLNYLKAQPICWEFPLTTQDKALNQFCEALVFSDSVTGVGSNEAIKNLELTIQKKRARNPRLADHNAAMEGNILAILYEYSYLMHIFHALDDMKFDTTKVDIEKLWLLIQQDCNARINNLDEEKRKNPTIQIVLDKYKYDNQINRLKVLNDATGREMDYIIAFIMAYSLLTVISLLLGNPKLLQPLKPYSADDIAGMMNALINASAGLRFTGYSR